MHSIGKKPIYMQLLVTMFRVIRSSSVCPDSVKNEQKNVQEAFGIKKKKSKYAFSQKFVQMRWYLIFRIVLSVRWIEYVAKEFSAYVKRRNAKDRKSFDEKRKKMRLKMVGNNTRSNN